MEYKEFTCGTNLVSIVVIVAGLAGCTSAPQYTGSEVQPGNLRCPYIAGHYYNLPKAASTRLFSSESHDGISCRDTKYCTLGSIIDEENGYRATVEIRQPEPGTLVFRRGDQVVTRSQSAGEYACDGANIVLPESEPGDEDTVRHLTQLSPDGDGSLIARVGVYTVGSDVALEGPVPLIFADSAWLSFEKVDDRHRTDWIDPLGAWNYLASALSVRSHEHVDAFLDQLCRKANVDHFSSTLQRVELAWWYQEAVWKFSHAWDASLRRALRAHGIRPDNKKAYMWLELAGREYRRFFGAGSISRDTSNEKQVLAEDMSSAEIEEALLLADRWEPSACAAGIAGNQPGAGPETLGNTSRARRASILSSGSPNPVFAHQGSVKPAIH